MSKFAVVIRCLDCGHKYRRTLTAADRNALDNVPDPPCPKCKVKAKRKHKGLKGIIAEQRAPVHTGTSLTTKAIDHTAEIVMQDYGLTDLKTNTREGESMAPELTPRQKKMNEHFWGGIRARKPLMDMKQTVSSAMQGAFLPGKPMAGDGAVSGNEVLTALHAGRSKFAPKTTIIASTDGKKISRPKPAE